MKLALQYNVRNIINYANNSSKVVMLEIENMHPCAMNNPGSKLCVLIEEI